MSRQIDGGVIVVYRSGEQMEARRMIQHDYSRNHWRQRANRVHQLADFLAGMVALLIMMAGLIWLMTGAV